MLQDVTFVELLDVEGVQQKGFAPRKLCCFEKKVIEGTANDSWTVLSMIEISPPKPSAVRLLKLD